jgi:acetoacetyl-CoA synthetase
VLLYSTSHILYYTCLIIVVGSVPSWPLYAGEVQSKSLGMAVQVYSQSGRNDLEDSGQPGELVCVMPFPSMPVALWGDKTGETYRKAYFDKFPGVWHHGDFLAVNPQTKGIIMLGRRYSSLVYEVFTVVMEC